MTKDHEIRNGETALHPLIAFAMPPPSQMASSPYRDPERSSSCTRVVITAMTNK